MRIEQHILYAIDDFEQNKKDSALMHAAIAIDATAQKLFKKARAGRSDYKNCIRNYYWLIERFIGEGLNLIDTKWTHLEIDNSGKVISDPDLADVIYHIFRCNHAHGNSIPLEYDLLPVSDGYSVWLIDLENPRLQMPERIIWALLGVSVFCEANSDIKTEGDYFLSWGSELLGLGIHKFIIKDWWGREKDLKIFFSQFQQIRVKMVL